MAFMQILNNKYQKQANSKFNTAFPTIISHNITIAFALVQSGGRN